MMPTNVKEIICRKLRKKDSYSPAIRSFALTLHFYSPKAYNYVRQTWDKLLPSPSTIRQWYRTVDGSPGFTKQALHAIALRSQGSTPTVVNLVIDEMSIREQIIYDKGRFYSGVDYGTLEDFQHNNACTPTAKNALMFMAVSLNDHWKVSIGYFLINNLNSIERANLLKLALQELHDSKCKVYSVTFDGAASNICMCTDLGANFYYGPKFKPYFINPITKEECYVFFDFCHMIKLVRNTLGDKKILKTHNGNVIAWDHIKKLQEFQHKEGLRAANKLTNNEITE